MTTGKMTRMMQKGTGSMSMDEDRHADERDRQRHKERYGMQVDGRSTKSLNNDRLESERLEVRRYRSSEILGKHVREAHGGFITGSCQTCIDITQNRITNLD